MDKSNMKGKRFRIKRKIDKGLSKLMEMEIKYKEVKI